MHLRNFKFFKRMKENKKVTTKEADRGQEKEDNSLVLDMFHFK